MSTEENKTPEENQDQNPETQAGVQPEAEAPQAAQTPEEQITALQEELLQNRDRMMRALADAENTRKRALKERDDASKYAVASFARDLLDFGDNFRRALKSLPEDTPPAVLEGLQAMDKELLNVFDRHGIRKIEPLDEPFDANYHEVMFETPMPGKAAGIIIQVVEPGYVLNDRLLRAAKVGIAKAEDTNRDPGAKIDQKA
jgi:molecular chaperone GrpE